MCGIAGLILFNQQPVTPAPVRRMLAPLRRRGPDGDGVYSQGSVAFGHTRLAIIDPAGGAQPFVDEANGLVLTFNGEVYNYKEIRAEIPDYPFKTQSDTEVVLAAYHTWGIDCLHKFRGMFAFALYDGNNQQVYLVRDPVGIKPLCYYQDAHKMLFASQLDALTASNLLQPEISTVGLSGYLRYQYVPCPHTIYKDIYKLEPGHYLHIDLTSARVTKSAYWELKVNPAPTSEAAALEQLNHLLDEIFRIYIRSDVPFGAFLSGGLDSSLVTAEMNRHLDQPVQTFSIGFNEEEYSETRFAAQASAIVGTRHTQRELSSDLSLELLEQISAGFAEPFCDSSAIPTYYVSQLAREKVKMVLSGDGGDELFAGYKSYPQCYRHYYLEGNGAGRGLPIQEMHDRRREIFRADEIAEIMRGPLFTPTRNFQDLCDDPITAFQYQDFKTYMVDDILTKVDRMSMAHSLEVRVPLLDHKLVEFAFTLPLDLKIKYRQQTTELISKYLLKESAARYYPQTFIHRPKMGFGIPVYPWMQGPFRHMIETRLRDKNQPLFQWLEQSYVTRLTDQYYIDGRRGLTARIWNLFMLTLWLDRVQRKSPEDARSGTV